MKVHRNDTTGISLLLLGSYTAKAHSITSGCDMEKCKRRKCKRGIRKGLTQKGKRDKKKRRKLETESKQTNTKKKKEGIQQFELSTKAHFTFFLSFKLRLPLCLRKKKEERKKRQRIGKKKKKGKTVDVYSLKSKIKQKKESAFFLNLKHTILSL